MSSVVRRVKRTPEDYAWHRYTGEMIRRIRIRRRLSLVQVGFRAEMLPRILEKIEQGILRLDIEEMHAIACALDVPIITLFPPEWLLPPRTKRRRFVVNRLPRKWMRACYRALGLGVAKTRLLVLS